MHSSRTHPTPATTTTPPPSSSIQIAAYFFSEAKGKDLFARLLSYYGKAKAALGSPHDPATAFWKKFSNDLSTHRKTLKLFKWVTDYRKAVDILRQRTTETPDVYWVCKAVAASAYVPYEFCNNVVWLRQVGLIADQGRWRQRAGDVAAQCRTLVALALFSVAVMDARREAAARREESSNAHTRRYGALSPVTSPWLHPRWIAVMWALTKAVADVGVYGQKSGFIAAVSGIELSSTAVSTCGIVGSVAGSVPLILTSISKVNKATKRH